jgi:hypothetical protein
MGVGTRAATGVGVEVGTGVGSCRVLVAGVSVDNGSTPPHATVSNRSIAKNRISPMNFLFIADATFYWYSVDQLSQPTERTPSPQAQFCVPLSRYFRIPLLIYLNECITVRQTGGAIVPERRCPAPMQLYLGLREPEQTCKIGRFG